MFELALPSPSGSGPYPEQAVPRAGWLDKTADALAAPFARRARARGVAATDIAALVGREQDALRNLTLEEIGRGAGELRAALRREGLTETRVAQSFALVRAAAERTLGMRHFDCQLVGGWVMLNGMIAEMDTGEGKTLTATLAASTAALAGMPVHIITVNDYLTARDAETMGPVYRALGLSVGTVVNGQSPDARRAAYACDVVYCTNKELTFDYLRDRLALGRRSSRAQLQIERLAGRDSRASRLVLRGLYFGIVDEADSVLVDEARTPLVISGRSDQAPELAMFRAALDAATRLTGGADFVVDARERNVRLTQAGQATLAQLAPGLPAVFQGRRRREELLTQALVALHLFQRDEHYIVRDEKVQIIDEYTGRILPDRSWELGLHQMIEAKEGTPLTGQQASVARMTYQRFFRRYLRLSGMTGTASEIAAELWSVYRLPVVRIPTNRPVRRRDLGTVVFRTAEEKWAAIGARARTLANEGRPVLIGTRSVAASERVSAALAAAGLAHQLLNARQDKEEAAIVSLAGQRGRITVATNMAGRGTDIKLGPGVAEAGGLAVIATELHESRRIDRQLYGRAARQGDPGSFEAIVSVQDELPAVYASRPVRGLAAFFARRSGRISQPALRRLLRAAQARAERHHAAIRRDLLATDERMSDLLAFSGKGE
ncbi:MAG: preprotein translocase subunit SecA [Burkholderiales bacterium]|jgi:preprotein translocase subunit SecA|nr:preprotein translocase subunit SecA [Burkholderiales bacterium]